MKLANLTEASQFGRGNIFWYLNTFFIEEDAYDDHEIKYFHVRDPYKVMFMQKHWVQPKEIDAVEVKFSGKKPVHLKIWALSSNGRSTPLSGNFLESFGEMVEIFENRKVDLPAWNGSNG